MNLPVKGQPLQQLRDVLAPAKLNLFLHITGRRDDGYHLLQSVFMLIDWCDTLHFDLREDGQILRRDTQTGHLPAHDLTVRAARALQQATGCALGVQITLDKCIPTEAGMGGGSSDAASCLLALNRLWGLGLDRTALAEIGLQLGADVPFFIGGHNAWVEGVGEQLHPVRLDHQRFVVVKPPAGASTARIFKEPALKRDTAPAIISGFAEIEPRQASGHLKLNIRTMLGASRNDLQPVAQALCPDVTLCLQWLNSQGLQGRMTGSGTAVFAPLWEQKTFCAAPSDWLVRECSNMVAHPLMDWCAG